MADPNPLLQPIVSMVGSEPPVIAFDDLITAPPDSLQVRSASSYTDLPYLFGVQDPNMITPKSKGNRRKLAPGAEPTKYKRTRSGCFTCRSRRVKCDETHPICERCRKGSRDCVYPEKALSSKAAAGGSSKSAAATSRHRPGSSSDDDEDSPERGRLEAIPDEDEHSQDAERAPPSTLQAKTSQTFSSSQQTNSRSGSEAPSLDKGTSPTPSTEGSVGYAASLAGGSWSNNLDPTSVTSEGLRKDWSHLPQDLQFYLTYFYNDITNLHYNLKTDPHDFLKTLFIDAALRNEALLNAVVGFSAFRYSLHRQVGKIQDFLPYYNKAVSLLLGSLKSGERRNVGTILAILQLATIEEYLGDWVNLFGHQKAAYEILTELYTPETIMQTAMSRAILAWYIRFDVSAALLGGFDTVLSRAWIAYAVEFYQHQITREPSNLVWKIELAFAQTRLIATDMSIVFAKKGKGQITHEQFLRENEILTRTIEEWKTKMDPALQDDRYMVKDFTGCREPEPGDIVNPFTPNVLYRGPLWPMNLATIDWYGTDIMHRYQTALATQSQPGADLVRQAYASCQLIDAIEYWRESPKGLYLILHACLGIASLFIAKDQAHNMWVRRKLAKIECNGYIFPYTFRVKMSGLFKDNSCMNWWLPNDEGYPPIIRSIRKFVGERISTAKDVSSESLRDMKTVFSSMRLDDTEPAAGDKAKMPEPEVAVASDQNWPTSGLPLGGLDDMA